MDFESNGFLNLFFYHDLVDIYRGLSVLIRCDC